MRLAGYARLAQACVSGESGAAENYLINEKFCLQHYMFAIEIQVTNSMILITSTSVSSLLPFYLNFHSLC